MKDDYLWDKSGEPDPEIRELEEILAPLRYQPKPLAMPRRRNYVPVAIAATVMIALLIAGVWLRTRIEKAAPPQEAKSVPSVYKKETTAPLVTNNPVLPEKPHRKHLPKPIFTKREREEALVAKQQLMFALRLASEKLKLAQRKTQGVRS